VLASGLSASLTASATSVPMTIGQAVQWLMVRGAAANQGRGKLGVALWVNVLSLMGWLILAVSRTPATSTSSSGQRCRACSFRPQ
jgi:hypothetical protein